nr:phosphatidylinositol 4-kinase alpha 1 [Tanacetum cinerariifolium]
MEALTELCDLIAQTPTQFPDKIQRLLNRSTPNPNPSQPTTRSYLNSILITSRFVSKCGSHYNSTNPKPQTLVLDYVKSISVTFDVAYWPKAFSLGAISEFYKEFFGYVVEICDGEGSEVGRCIGEVVMSAIRGECGDVAVTRCFLSAVGEFFPKVDVEGSEKVVEVLLSGVEGGLRIGVGGGGDFSPSNSAQSSPISGGGGMTSSGNGIVEEVNLRVGGGGDKKGVGYFEEELIENLEKQEIAFKLIEHIVERAKIDPVLLERAHVITKDQLKSISSFLKIRKRDWTEQGSSLKARINTKLSVYKAAVNLKIKSLASLYSDGKSSKKLLHGALALLVEAAEACVYSVWRKLRVCEDLFSSLLDGISKIAVTSGGHLLRVLFIRFKPLVLATCAQADTWGSSQGAMFESVLKASYVGLAAESKSGSSGDDFLGPLLPAVADILSDFDPTGDVEPSLLKLFRNLLFYIAEFGLAPPVVKSPISLKPNSTTLSNGGKTTVGGPYMWNPEWSSAVQRISQGTPPLVVSSVKWLEDELELNTLHNPGSRRGNGNEKAAVSQRTALSAALGGRVEVGAMSTISGVKATYLLAVACLEIIRFSSNGGILNCAPGSTASKSAFSCVFEYLKSPNLMPAVSQCLMAIVHCAFETALSWLESQICETGDAAEVRESTLAVHACFLIKNLSSREEHIRDLSVNLLSQLRERFPQILWKSSCLDSLLFYMNNNPPSAFVNDPALIVSVRSLYQKVVREWIIISLSHAPCTSQGLLQEQLSKLRPQLAPGEPEAPPEKDPIQEILAHRLWLGFFIDRFEYQGNLHKFKLGLQLLEDRIYRASLGWFCHQPEWYETNNGNFAYSEAQSLHGFVQFLLSQRVDAPQNDSIGQGQENGSELLNMKDSYHPDWGSMENNAAGREKRKQLLIMLCQHEAERLDVWAQPLGSKEKTSYRLKINSEKWTEHARTAFSVDPRIAFSLGARFPTNLSLKAELTQLVQLHILEIRTIPEALSYFVTPKAVDEDSPLLQQLTHWAACSIAHALEYFTPAYKGYLIRAAQRSDVFAHILIWHLQGENCAPEQGKEPVSAKTTAFLALLPLVRERIIDGFTPKARDIFRREFDFFEKVTSISGVLYPLPKEERRAGIRRELEKIQLDGDDLYLPTAPNKLVKGIQVNSGIPLQSAAKVPIMITFDVADRNGDPNDIKPQACIFKVGDDCRQDVLALQVISLLKDIFEAVGLDLYLFPYGVLPTDPERGIIEVVPNTHSRSQMGDLIDGGLYEMFQQEFGAIGSANFEAARHNFIISSAGYAVASFAHFKLSHEMSQLLDPSGAMKSETWFLFVSLCVKGYLAARRYMDEIINTVLMMVESGLPCFSRGDPIGNLRKRFHPEMSEREAANFMMHICADAYDKWSTAGYDLIQYLQQGIEK